MRINKTIKLLLLSDIFVTTGFGFIDPIFGIFINEKIVGGNIFAVGIASTLFLLVKSFIQLPFSRYIDNQEQKGIWLFIGYFFIATVPFVYIFAQNISTIYLAQVIFGLGSGLVYPTWLGLWSINLDKQHEAYEWSLYSTLTGLGTAFTALVGAAVANFIGFSYTFVLVGIMSLLGCAVLYFLETQNQYFKKK